MRMRARFAAVDPAIQALVRRQQDAAQRYAALDKEILTEISRPSRVRQYHEILSRLRTETKNVEDQLEALDNKGQSAVPPLCQPDPWPANTS